MRLKIRQANVWLELGDFSASDDALSLREVRLAAVCDELRLVPLSFSNSINLKADCFAMPSPVVPKLSFAQGFVRSVSDSSKDLSEENSRIGASQAWIPAHPQQIVEQYVQFDFSEATFVEKVGLKGSGDCWVTKLIAEQLDEDDMWVFLTELEGNDDGDTIAFRPLEKEVTGLRLYPIEFHKEIRMQTELVIK